MSFVRTFALWLEEKELPGRPDARRVATEVVEVALRIAEHASIEDGSRTLDLGAGTGAIALGAADRGARVVAVDVDADALRRGRQLAAALEAPVAHVAADARALPFPDATFDASVHRSVLVYMADRPRAVAEERRVLRPGATVSCSESLGAELDLEANESALDRVWQGGLRGILHESRDAFAVTGDGLEALYVEAGFEDVRVAVEPRRVLLDSGDAVARAFATTPPAGLSARERWLRAGVPAPLVDEFLARLALAAERGRPAHLLAGDAFLAARAPA